MKRKYRMIGLVSAFVLVIGILIFGIIRWNTQVAETTEKAKEELKMDEKTKEDSNINEETPAGVGEDAIKDDHSTNQKNNSESDHEQSQSDGSEPATDSTEQKDSANDNGNSSFQGGDGNLPSNTVPTLTEIKGAYRNAFSDLEVQQASQIDQLLVQAKADYVSGKLSKADLTVKYQGAAATLESNADQMFNAVYQQLQTDLEKNGYNLNEATEFRSQYQAKKQARLSHAINQLQQF